MKTQVIAFALLAAAVVGSGGRPVAQEGEATAAKPTFDAASAEIQRKLDASIQELEQVRQQVVDELLPLSDRLSKLEASLRDARSTNEQKNLAFDQSSLDLSIIREDITKLENDETFLSGLLVDYQRRFEAALHIVELQRYEEDLQKAKLASDNSSMTTQEVFGAQTDLIGVALDRLDEVVGGALFRGRAVDPNGLVDEGTFALVGPAALFLSADGKDIGTAEQRLGSLEPTVIEFAKPEDAAAARSFVEAGNGDFPLDPTLGNAHKVAATEETLLEHIGKGGAVMYPILGLAGLALLVCLYKWLSFVLIRRPSRRQIRTMFEAIENGDEQAANAEARNMSGPLGQMLTVGVEHMREPRELVEEVMFERVLTTRFKLNSFLPFIAVCAASAPLLGLLGTVTGIIDTFKLITIFGSGDVKTLSGGISEALITTEFGLIVAIPSLLLHAYLSRKARGIVGEMEALAVRFVNEVSRRMPQPRAAVAPAVAPRPGVADPEVAVSAAAAADSDLVRAQVSQILSEMLGPLENGNSGKARTTG